MGILSKSKNFPTDRTIKNSSLQCFRYRNLKIFRYYIINNLICLMFNRANAKPMDTYFIQIEHTKHKLIILLADRNRGRKIPQVLQ